MPVIEIQDFGPIRKASIELKPLTVFFGPNNTGKSYLALAIYSLSRTLSGQAPSRRGLPFGHLPRFSDVDAVLSPELVKQAAKETMKSQSKAGLRGPVVLKLRELPDLAQELVKSTLKSFADSLTHTFGTEVQRCFGTRVSGLGRHGTGIEAQGFRLTVSDADSGLTWQMRSNVEDSVTSQWEGRIPELDLKLGREIPPWGVMRREADMFFNYMCREVADRYFRAVLSRAYYLPASRSGILLGHRTLASLIVERASRAWLEPLEVPSFPGVITDLIQVLLAGCGRMGIAVDFGVTFRFWGCL